MTTSWPGCTREELVAGGEWLRLGGLQEVPDQVCPLGWCPVSCPLLRSPFCGHSLLDPGLWVHGAGGWLRPAAGAGARAPSLSRRPALCCSFTWSAARTDRNVISVLSGQVVEVFDRQFQELYLTSHSVSLKGVPMEKEPEPEPIVLPSVVPLVPSGTMAKKLVNPKYALVKAKSADELAKTSSEKQEATRPLGARGPDPAERPAELPEPPPPIHPGLLNLERANMFEYLPTWVEPDPEPGSDILGYINIIDPNIWNPQPSQMNRIKIRDTSQAWRQSQDSSAGPANGVPAQNGLPQGDAEPRPPVPKPRTVPVADLLARDGGGLGWALESPEEEAPQHSTDLGPPRTAGPGPGPLQRQLSTDAPDGQGAAVPNGLDGEEEEEEDDDDYVTLSDQDSLSGSSGRGPGPRRPSVASSSVSDEYFEVTERSATLRRRHSEQVANGPAQPPRRQLSAPHLTRGTFAGPLGGPSWAQGREREEVGTLTRMQAPRSADKEAQVGRGPCARGSWAPFPEGRGRQPGGAAHSAGRYQCLGPSAPASCKGHLRPPPGAKRTHLTLQRVQTRAVTGRSAPQFVARAAAAAAQRCSASAQGRTAGGGLARPRVRPRGGASDCGCPRRGGSWPLPSPPAAGPRQCPGPVLPGNSTRLIMPGMTIRPMGSILR